MSRARIAFALVLFAAGSASAQSLPPIRQSKEAATRAVQATNAHTATMTADQAGPASRTPAPSGARSDSTRPSMSGRATQSVGGSAAMNPSVERLEERVLEREIFTYTGAGRRDPLD